MQNRPSIAQNIFQDIIENTSPFAFLQSKVLSTPPTYETEWLDFKCGREPNGPLPPDKVKKIWSEALAGFATTNGGVLVWGIEAKKLHGDTVDQAIGLCLVPDPDGFRSRLQELHRQATDPPILGVEIRAIPDPTKSDQGFVVCYIPESSYKPHRAEWLNKRWVIRCGDNFDDVPPPVLRSLFFPRRQSYMRMEVVVKHTYLSPGRIDEVRLQLSLFNEGPASAHDLYILASQAKGVIYSFPHSWKGGSSPQGYQIRYPEVVHVGEKVDLGSQPFDLHAVGLVGSLHGAKAVPLSFRIYATDQEPTQIDMEVTGEMLASQGMAVGLPKPLPISRFA